MPDPHIGNTIEQRRWSSFWGCNNGIGRLERLSAEGVDVSALDNYCDECVWGREMERCGKVYPPEYPAQQAKPTKELVWFESWVVVALCTQGQNSVKTSSFVIANHLINPFHSYALWHARFSVSRPDVQIESGHTKIESVSESSGACHARQFFAYYGQ
jgi:hypothetical protein